MYEEDIFEVLNYTVKQYEVNSLICHKYKLTDPTCQIRLP